MRDTSVDYEEYRVLVDLEWSAEVKVQDYGYGNKKVWVLLCDLMSPYRVVC